MSKPITPHRYRSVSAVGLLHTIEQLHRRVDERFHQRGISAVCSELLDVTRSAQANAQKIDRPIWWLRVINFLLLAGILEGVIFGVQNINIQMATFTWAELLEAIDAGFNILVLGGAAIFFIITLEIRLKRNRALRAIHELRSLAHVIDMHQLTKDPERILLDWRSTPSSPVESLTAFELTRYLDYCSEMLSIIGKIAVLYVQGFEDEGALSAVYEIENLTLGLSRKIWQKIMIIRGLESDLLTAEIPPAAGGSDDEGDGTPTNPLRPKSAPIP